MSTIESFKNAPVGATATHPDGRRMIKTTGAICPWHSTNGTFLYDYEIVDFVLDPLPPSTAREALDLAWELAHPVKEGQELLQGTRAIGRVGDTIVEYTLRSDWVPCDYESVRTLDPLPDPTPDWTKAPAVLASHPLCADTEQIGLWLPVVGREGMWAWPRGEFSAHWSELEDVTPLYPKGQDA